MAVTGIEAGAPVAGEVPVIASKVFALLVAAGYARPRTYGASVSPAAGVLSARELEVLRLMAEGLATKQIAARLGRSVKTVETHRHGVMAKLGIDSVALLTKYAIREGLTSVEG